MKMKKEIFGITIVVILFILLKIFFSPSRFVVGNAVKLMAYDPKNTTYSIDGSTVTLLNGVAETEAAPGSASKIITRYFGNELEADLDGDGDKDVAFVLTQERGGSGTFFYAVAALKTDRGYIGSDGYLLGDRIAPMATNISSNPRQKYVVVFNYADRPAGAPMITKPSVAKSVYLKIDPQNMRWALVEPDFEGESASFEPYRATLIGKHICLPHKNQEGPQTLECALGLLTDDGDYYALDFNLPSQGFPNIATGSRLKATGLVTPVERLNSDHWQKYPIVGIFSVTDSFEVLK